MTFAYMSHVYFSYNFLARHSNVLFSDYKEYQISSAELDLVKSYNRKKKFYFFIFVDDPSYILKILKIKFSPKFKL